MGHDSRTSTETGQRDKKWDRTVGQEMGQHTKQEQTRNGTRQDKNRDRTAGHEMGQDKKWDKNRTVKKNKKKKTRTDISTHSCCGWELAPSSWYVLTSVSGSETTRLSPDATDV